MGTKSPSEHAQDNRANQLNPTHPEYHHSRGASEDEAEDQASHDQAGLDNYSRQLNPNNDAYWQSRGKSKP